MQLRFHTPDTQATQQLAARLADCCQDAMVFYLEGTLGAGKTTFSQGFIRQLGVSGRIKSPTYTLVEPYEAPPWRIFHFDLYRLADPEELEFIGIRDYFDDDCICLIEWPDKGQGLLAPADIIIRLEIQGDARAIALHAQSARGEHLLTTLEER